MIRAVRLTANFDANLQEVQTFLADAGAVDAFDALLAYLFDELIPNLQLFPRLGRTFLDIEPQSLQGQARRRTVQQLVGANTELREYIARDYVVLYAVRGATVFLLSIRHHRQLSFDLRRHW
jgi:plasmid stabilization system protein ParE